MIFIIHRARPRDYEYHSRVYLIHPSWSWYNYNIHFELCKDFNSYLGYHLYVMYSDIITVQYMYHYTVDIL